MPSISVNTALSGNMDNLVEYYNEVLAFDTVKIGSDLNSLSSFT